MKKILLIAFLIPIMANSQDTTILTLSCKARLVQTFAKLVKRDEDTAYVNLFNRWLRKFDVPAPPSGTTQVSVDSIKVVVIASLYDYAMNFPQGASPVGSDFASDISSIRASSTFLDRLCDAIDNKYNLLVPDIRTKGRPLLTAKNQLP